MLEPTPNNPAIATGISNKTIYEEVNPIKPSKSFPIKKSPIKEPRF